MTSRTVSGCARSAPAAASTRARCRAWRASRAGRPAGPSPPTGLAELRLGQQLQHQLEHRVARVERLHVDVQVRAELAGAAQQRAQPVGRVALAALGCVRAQQRRERRHLHREVRARQRARAVGLERRALGPVARRAGDRDQRVVAALRVALRLALRDRRLAQQVDRAGDPVAPQLAQRPERRLRRLADDEPVGHVLDPGRRRRAERRPSRARVAHPQRDRDRRRGRLDLAEEAGQVPREVVERPARRHHVDEPEQRRLELRVLRRQLHRLVVRRLQRAPHPRRQRRGEPLAHLQQPGLQHRVVDALLDHGHKPTPRTAPPAAPARGP